MNKFELAERIAEIIDGSWATTDEKNTNLIRTKLEECNGSIEITVGKKKFSVDIREI